MTGYLAAQGVIASETRVGKILKHCNETYNMTRQQVREWLNVYSILERPINVVGIGYLKLFYACQLNKILAWSDKNANVIEVAY